VASKKPRGVVGMHARGRSREVYFEIYTSGPCC
jgi:hypothetical protein